MNTQPDHTPAIPPVSSDLARAMVDAYAHSGQPSSAVMPTGRTDDVRRALTRMMADPAFLGRHLAALHAGFEAARLELPLAALIQEPPSFERIAAGGFDDLADIDLAFLATDPDALLALSEYLHPDDGTARPLGDWFARAAAEHPVPLPPWVGTTGVLVPHKGGTTLATAVTVPAGPRAVKPRRRFPDALRPLLTTAAMLVIGCGATFVLMSASDARADSNRIAPKLDAAAPLRDATSAADLDRMIVAFEEAAVLASEANWVWRVFYTEQRKAIASLRADFEVAVALRKVYRQTNGIWLTAGGVAEASAAYTATFRNLGLFPPPAGGRQAGDVSADDHKQAEVVVRGRENIRRLVLSAIDHWVSILVRAPEKREGWEATADRLRSLALALERDEADGPPLRTIRTHLAKREFSQIEKILGSEKYSSRDAIRRFPIALFGHIYWSWDAASGGDAVSLRLFAERFAAHRPKEPEVNTALTYRDTVMSPLADTALTFDLRPGEATRHHITAGQAATRQHTYGLVVADETNSVYQAQFARALADTGAAQEAMERYQIAVALAAERGRPFALVHANLGIVYLCFEMYPEAERSLETAIAEANLPGQQSAATPFYHYYLARTLMDAGRDRNRVIQAAEDSLRLYLATAGAPPPATRGNERPGPDAYVRCLVLLGRAHMDLRRLDAAAARLESAVRLRPKWAEPVFWLAEIMHRRGRPEEAIRLAERAVTLSEETRPEFAAWLARYYRDSGKLSLAAEWFGKAIELGRADWSNGVDVGDAAKWDRLAADAAAYAATGKGTPSLDLGAAAMFVGRSSTAATVLTAALDKSRPDDPLESHYRVLAVAALTRAGRFGDLDRPANPEALHAAGLERAKADLLNIRSRLGAELRPAPTIGGAPDTPRDSLLDRLAEYETSTHLAVVRQEDQLAKLEATEQAGWRAFWREVDEVTTTLRRLPPDSRPVGVIPMKFVLGGF